MRELLLEVMRHYLERIQSDRFNKEAPMYQLINYQIKDKLLSLIEDEPLIVSASCGQGNWTNFPWIAIMNRNITTTTQQGVYIVYLFSKDMKRLYITLNQGFTNLEKQIREKYKGQRIRLRLKEAMFAVSESVRQKVNAYDFTADRNVKIGKPEYEDGTIFYKEYNIESFPTDEELQRDLHNMIDVYRQYYDEIYVPGLKHIKEDGNEWSADMGSEKSLLMQMNTYMKAKGFYYHYEDLANFYLSLKIKPFVILAGISGSGKSKLVRLFAEFLGATKENGRFHLIPVRPDWNDSTELMGYKNLSEEFVPGVFTRIVLEASKNKDVPYFVCLDEMNLARVEYYLSDYLSLIESRDWNEGEIVTDSMFTDPTWLPVDYQQLYIPENVYLVGTVNMDDTTFGFSRKVLDRANTIECSQVYLEIMPFTNESVQKRKEMNDFLRPRFLHLKDALEAYREYVIDINNEIMEIHRILQKANIQFGYRVRDEIVFYMLENKEKQLLDEEVAFDYAIMQKILPSITGNDYRIKQALIELYNVCNPTYQIADGTNYLIDGEEHIEDARYKKSAAKIINMLRGYEDGFATFW
jgi:5-methylcytosine-specific restriction enzyme B